MNLFNLLPLIFAWAAAALVLFSVLPLLSSAPAWQCTVPRRIAAAVLTLSAVLIGFWIFLLALYAGVGLYPFAQVLLFIPFRGQYAWTYWLYLAALLLAQFLWHPRLRSAPAATLTIGLLCFLGIHASRLALLVWGSH